MIVDMGGRIASLQQALGRSLLRLATVTHATGGVCTGGSLLDGAHDDARDILRDLVAACPHPDGHGAAPDDRTAWCLERCGDASTCPLERIMMDVAFVVGSLDRVEHDPAWAGAYLPQAASRLQQIVAEWPSIAGDLPCPDDPLSCPGGLARASRTPQHVPEARG